MKKIAIAASLAAAACSDGGAPANDQAAGSQTAAAPANVSANSAANVAAPVPGGAADLAGARAAIERIYAAYRTDAGPDLEGLFTPELDAAIARDSEMEGGGLSYDPFCQCQDFENLTHRIEAVDAESENEVVARVSVTNAGAQHRLAIRLARRGAGWKVADVHNGERSLLAGR